MREGFHRISPLADVAIQGRFGADKGAPGVELSVRHPLSIVTVIARKDKAEALSAALAGLKGCVVQWAGADQYYAVSETYAEGALYRELREKLAGLASLSDQSHGRIVIRIAGPKARAVLAKGTPVDLHPNEFLRGKSAVTQMAHVGVHLTRTGEDAFELSVFRGFSENFWEWLTGQAEEFGYQVS
ncbi:MAG: sarcosine oxidase subunit gamma [Rhizobiales bacterium]|nr:sarcosine oxidase subunit gamma [Hyphomicrobiales bacterium]MBI3672726.1 sarcosine oxidase subunit gamma [Hyphomicrobiales bacterium]